MRLILKKIPSGLSLSSEMAFITSINQNESFFERKALNRQLLQCSQGSCHAYLGTKARVWYGSYDMRSHQLKQASSWDIETVVCSEHMSLGVKKKI